MPDMAVNCGQPLPLPRCTVDLRPKKPPINLPDPDTLLRRPKITSLMHRIVYEVFEEDAEARITDNPDYTDPLPVREPPDTACSAPNNAGDRLQTPAFSSVEIGRSVSVSFCLVQLRAFVRGLRQLCFFEGRHVAGDAVAVEVHGERGPSSCRALLGETPHVPFCAQYRGREGITVHLEPLSFRPQRSTNSSLLCPLPPCPGPPFPKGGRGRHLPFNMEKSLGTFDAFPAVFGYFWHCTWGRLCNGQMCVFICEPFCPSDHAKFFLKALVIVLRRILVAMGLSPHGEQENRILYKRGATEIEHDHAPARHIALKGIDRQIAGFWQIADRKCGDLHVDAHFHLLHF